MGKQLLRNQMIRRMTTSTMVNQVKSSKSGSIAMRKLARSVETTLTNTMRIMNATGITSDVKTNFGMIVTGTKKMIAAGWRNWTRISFKATKMATQTDTGMVSLITPKCQETSI